MLARYSSILITPWYVYVLLDTTHRFIINTIWGRVNSLVVRKNNFFWYRWKSLATTKECGLRKSCSYVITHKSHKRCELY